MTIGHRTIRLEVGPGTEALLHRVLDLVEHAIGLETHGSAQGAAVSNPTAGARKSGAKQPFVGQLTLEVGTVEKGIVQMFIFDNDSPEGDRLPWVAIAATKKHAERRAEYLLAAIDGVASLEEVTSILSAIYRGDAASVQGKVLDAIDSANAALHRLGLGPKGGAA